LILADDFRLELSVRLNDLCLNVSFLLLLLLLQLILVNGLRFTKTTLTVALIKGLSSALAELHVLLHLLLDVLLGGIELNSHISKAVSEGLTLVFQFFLILVLHLDATEVLNLVVHSC